MSIKKPLAIYDGVIKELQSGDTLPKVDIKTIVIDNPAVGGILLCRLYEGWNIVRVDSAVKAATSVTFNLEERTAVGSAGTDVTSSDMVADTDGTATTSFSNAAIAADNWLYADISAVSGTPGTLTITIAYTT
jgi:hypothetical protein